MVTTFTKFIYVLLQAFYIMKNMFITFVLFHGNYCKPKKSTDITKIRRGKRWTSEVGSRLPYLKDRRLCKNWTICIVYILSLIYLCTVNYSLNFAEILVETLPQMRKMSSFCKKKNVGKPGYEIEKCWICERCQRPKLYFFNNADIHQLYVYFISPLPVYLFLKKL